MEQQQRVREESAKLQMIDQELKKLNAQEQADISILREKLESTNRDLVWLVRLCLKQ